jgi:hypothetical protein
LSISGSRTQTRHVLPERLRVHQAATTPARTAITNGGGEDAQAIEGWRSDETRARIAAFVANLDVRGR